MISGNLMAQQYFYIKFIISSALVTNGINLLDIPHKATVLLGSCLHKRKQKNAKVKSDYVDEREFELGYMYSYVFVVFLNGLLFCTIVPLISVFVALYFWIKYLVDKNNLLFLYVKIYESGGQFRDTTLRFMIFNVVFYLAAISSLFATMIGHVYITAIGFFIGCVFGLVLYFLLVDGEEIPED
jgi:ABC-type Fe3+ transport system permease subunit